MQADELPEAEQERRERIDELADEHGPRWLDAFKPGSFGCHELLDRTLLVANLVEQSILSHPACVHDPEWFALARQASDALAELYQRVGAAHLAEEDDQAPPGP